MSQKLKKSFPQEYVVDFVLMEDSQKVNILMTVCCKGEDGQQMQLRSFPTFELLYGLQVRTHGVVFEFRFPKDSHSNLIQVSPFCHLLDCCVDQV